MWPWEHAAVGYLLFSLVIHVAYRRPPDEPSVLVLLIATQFPDLVDKPLSWGFGVFPGGHALGHSLFVAVPVGVAAVVVARRSGHGRRGLAILVGYWSHLASDVVDPLRNGDGVDVGRVLWPLVEQEPYGEDLGLGRGFVYLREFAADLLAMDVPGTAAVFLLLPAFALAVWVNDGAPGVAILVRTVRHR